jgi:hypothetical protein
MLWCRIHPRTHASKRRANVPCAVTRRCNFARGVRAFGRAPDPCNLVRSRKRLPARAVSTPGCASYGHSQAVCRSSSSRVKLGKADLTLTPLKPKSDMYVGDYRLRVVPYFFKNEEGSLVLTAPQESYHRLAQGSAVEFNGVATNKKDGKRKIVIGKIIPLTSDRGRVTFSVATENGEMVFNTLYHFAP